MDCHDALEILEADALGAWDAEPDLVDEARRHLAECDRCRTAWPQRHDWGRKLSAAMQAVVTPPGLADRLSAQLPVAAAVNADRPSSSARRIAWVGGVVAAAVATVLLFAFWPASPPVTLEQLRAASDASWEELPQFVGRGTPPLPHEWGPFFELEPSQVRAFSPLDSAQTVALVPFQFVLRRGTEPLQGRLLILRTRQLVDAELPNDSFATAPIRYLRGGRGAWIVWTEGDWVFACLMSSDRAPVELDQFRRALTRSRPLG